MNYELKKRVFDFIKSHPEQDSEYKVLYEGMERELEYYDMDSQCLSADDLKCYDGEALREALGKKEGEGYTMQDVIVVGESMNNYLADEFGENLYYTIHECL